MKKKEFKEIIDVLFIVGILFSLTLFFGIFIRGYKNTSVIENRKLVNEVSFDSINILNGNFQNNFETFLSDQLIFSDFVKIKYNSLSTNISSKLISLYNNIDAYGNYKYVQVKDDIFRFVYGEHLFNKYFDYEENFLILKESIDTINKNIDSVDIPKYMYYISTSKSRNLNEGNEDLFYKYISETINVDNLSMFDFNGYEDYKKYFYKTDHHWNYLGSYKGYTEIMKLLNNVNVITPLKEVPYNMKFYGSFYRNTLDNSVYDDFSIYKFNLPFYNTYINGVNKVYGSGNNYDIGNYSSSMFTNRYGEYYGADHGEIIYDFNKNNENNLLIIATSFSNPINNLIASNYDKTYVIDLRHIYDYDENFDFKSYVCENSIDEILLIGDINFFVNNENRFRED